MRRTHSLPRTILLYLATALVLIFFLGPILWFVALAFRPAGTAFANPPEFFFRPQLDAFVYTLIDPGVNARQLLNSIIVAGGSTLLNIPFALPAAYALSRFNLRWKRNIMLWYIGLLMAPPVVFLIPYFIFMSRLHLNGTYLAMIIMMQTLTIPFSVWLLKGFFDDVPFELEEAAQVDGARWYRLLWHVYLPPSRPTIIAFALVSVSFHWNSLLWPLVVTSDKARPLTMGLLRFTQLTDIGAQWSLIMAATLIIMAPLLIVFLIFQRQFIRSFMHSGIK